MIEAVALWVALPLLGMAFLMCVARLAVGPTLADRIVALDIVTSIVIGILLVHAIAARQPVLLDVGVTLALLAFLAIVAFARYYAGRMEGR